MPEQLQDINKNCKDCGKPFIFGVKDQQFFKKMVAEKKWASYKEPERCVKCRRQRQQADSVSQ